MLYMGPLAGGAGGGAGRPGRQTAYQPGLKPLHPLDGGEHFGPHPDPRYRRRDPLHPLPRPSGHWRRQRRQRGRPAAADPLDPDTHPLNGKKGFPEFREAL